MIMEIPFSLQTRAHRQGSSMGCQKTMLTSVMISSPIVWIWLPRADLGSACKLAPQSPGLPQTKGLSVRVSWSILKLREVSSLSVGTIYSFQKRSSDQTYVNKHKQILEKVGDRSPDLSHDQLPNLVSQIVTVPPL